MARLRRTGVRRRGRRAIALIVATVAVAGFSLAVLLRGGPGASPPPASSPARNGDLQLMPLAGWKPSQSIPQLPGMRFSSPIAFEEPASGMRLLAGLMPVTTANLLPAEFVRSLQSPLGRPETIQLGRGLHAYYFPRLTVLGLEGPLDLYLLPTTKGVATLACAGSDAVGPYYECWKNLATLRLHGARALALGPDAGFRQRLTGAIAALDTARENARAGLATRVPSEQARSAGALAAAYDSAAASLRPLAPATPSAPRETVRMLAATARAYRGVVAALSAADEVAFARGSAVVHAREGRLKRLLHRRVAR